MKYRHYMTDATVEDPDRSEAELITVEPDEDASKEENSQVEFDSATEAKMIMNMHNRKMASLKHDVASRINKIAKLHKAMLSEGRISPILRTILLEEGIVDDSVVDASPSKDVEEADIDATPLDEKSASEKELVEASMKAQHRVLLALYKKLN